MASSSAGWEAIASHASALQVGVEHMVERSRIVQSVIFCRVSDMEISCFSKWTDKSSSLRCCERNFLNSLLWYIN